MTSDGQTVTLAIPMSAEEYKALTDKKGGTAKDKEEEKSKLMRYVSKQALITGTIAYMLSSFVRQGTDEMVGALFSPLQNVDLNADGVADLVQLAAWKIELGRGFGAVPCGKILVEVIKNAFGAALTIAIVHMLLETTDLLDSELGDDKKS